MPRCTVGSRQAEHESQGESIEEDDMVIRVGMAIPRTETNRWGGKGCKPKGAYKEVPRASRRLALAAAKRSLTISFKVKDYYKIYTPIGIKEINLNLE